MSTSAQDRVDVPSGISIRTALPDEINAAGKVTLSGFAMREEDGGRRDEASGDVAGQYLDAAARSADGELIVAVDWITNAVVGTASLLRAGTRYARLAEPGEAELRFVTVLPAYRGWGIAQAMTAEAVRLAGEWGVDALVLASLPRGRSGQRVYQRLGFVRVPERERARAEEGRRALHVFQRRLRPDSKEFDIRLVRPSEYERLADVLVSAYSQEFELPPDYLADIRAVGARAHEHNVWVAVDREQGTLLGSVTTPSLGRTLTDIAQPGEIDVRLLGVATHARGRGVGARLMGHSIEQARLGGAHRVVLTTGPEMFSAHRLYERLGFVRLLDREPVFAPDGTPLRVYAFDL